MVVLGMLFFYLEEGGRGGRGGAKKWLHQTGGHSKLGRFYFLLYSNDDINITTSRSFV